jgi:predicted Ser/Thr protein kinase
MSSAPGPSSMSQPLSPPASAEPVLALKTHKNRVLIYEDRVQKTLGSSRHAALHARREVKALGRLAGLERVPVLLALGLDRKTVIMSRVPGKPLSECELVTEFTMASLRRLVEQILARGIARHSLPPRDVIVAEDGTAGLVDFERSTRPLFPGDPAWLIAKQVMRFHLLRLLATHAPQLLTRGEQRWLRWLSGLRTALQPAARLRSRVLRALRRG